MRRRAAIRGCLGCLAALSGCAAGLPEATGPRNPPAPPADEPRRTPDRPAIVVGTFDFESGDDGGLRVFGTVRNRGDVRRSPTVRVTVGIDGEEFVRDTTVTVDPGATAEWAVLVDVAYDRFRSGGSIDVAVA